MNRRAALAALFAGAACIATSAIWVRLSEVGPLATAFWRVALALPVLWAWALLLARAGHATAPRPGERAALLVAGACFAGDLALWHGSILLTSVANATLLANFAPIFVTLVVWLVLGQRPADRFLLALAVAMAGTVLLLASPARAGTSPGLALLGDALGLGTAMFYAGYQLAMNRARHRLGAATAMAWSSLVCAMLLLPIALASGESLWPTTTTGWGILVGLALVSQVAGQTLIAWALAHLRPTVASVGLLLQPVIAAGYAWLVLAEGIGLAQATGGALVLLGIWLSTRSDTSADTRPPGPPQDSPPGAANRAAGG